MVVGVEVGIEIVTTGVWVKVGGKIFGVLVDFLVAVGMAVLV